MKVAMFYGPGDVRLEEKDIPEIKDTEVLVRIRAALTCGTDVKTYRRGHRLLPPPSPFGHEYAGDVVAVGKMVEKVTEGTRVVAANSAPCGHCFYCKRGRESLCENLFFVWGAFSEYIVVPERIVKKNLLTVPDHVTYEEAALTEPLACVIHGVEESAICMGDTVVINGAGPIGLFFTALVKQKGARVIQTDLVDERLSVAETLGADHIINAQEGEDATIKKVKALTEGRGADIAIEAVGYPKIWETTIKMTRKGGTATLFGGCEKNTAITVDTSLLHYSEITMKGVFHHTPQYIRTALNLISWGAIDTKTFITEKMPLSRIDEALQKVLAQKGVKIALIP
ncbi:MAG: zinc-binding dehydrogenase [Theionarchaea archaeon]|nr:zinc-binding dehydrogenase [Theionarchaea archaeon]MBU6999822.1 zinc-binding dehydrogenase [Theionarchaea archaeon]MBU7020242.1 zinc-binding dehydrogenase [Theionarchaea archaeon]MBU7033639.1 zinc-binding dehydrogenase [Theionarchaea archaeon]MBU7040078.1 zinc-binding dehydrogenase [Theionarchaea archaeon]